MKMNHGYKTIATNLLWSYHKNNIVKVLKLWLYCTNDKQSASKQKLHFTVNIHKENKNKLKDRNEDITR